mmetsp:Transcript_12358/g.36290  ORF Transcript_12358/g.36290 Transcript_12358/m.36290 type:complete len:1575 (-) Transcript_12358:138-4862(-)
MNYRQARDPDEDMLPRPSPRWEELWADLVSFRDRRCAAFSGTGLMGPIGPTIRNMGGSPLECLSSRSVMAPGRLEIAASPGRHFWGDDGTKHSRGCRRVVAASSVLSAVQQGCTADAVRAALISEERLVGTAGRAEVDPYGHTALHLECVAGREPDVIAVLLEAYPDAAMARDGKGRTPLEALLQSLSPSQPKLSSFSSGRTTSLRTLSDTSCEQEQVSSVVGMLLRAEMVLNGSAAIGAICHGARGTTLLRLACQAGPYLPSDVATLLLRTFPGAASSVSVVRTSHGAGKADFSDTPLHAAVRCGSAGPVVQALVQAYPEAGLARDSKGQTPLSIALEKNCELKYGDLDAKHDSAQAEATSDDVILTLIASCPQCASVLEPDGVTTPLVRALLTGRPASVVRELLRADPSSAGAATFASASESTQDFTSSSDEIIANMSPPPREDDASSVYTPLRIAAEIAAEEVVIAVLEACPSAASLADSNGEYPLLTAVLRLQRANEQKSRTRLRETIAAGQRRASLLSAQTNLASDVTDSHAHEPLLIHPSPSHGSSASSGRNRHTIAAMVACSVPLEGVAPLSLRAVTALLSACPAAAACSNVNGTTPLLVACQNSMDGVVLAMVGLCPEAAAVRKLTPSSDECDKISELCIKSGRGFHGSSSRQSIGSIESISVGCTSALWNVLSRPRVRQGREGVVELQNDGSNVQLNNLVEQGNGWNDVAGDPPVFDDNAAAGAVEPTIAEEVANIDGANASQSVADDDHSSLNVIQALAEADPAQVLDCDSYGQTILHRIVLEMSRVRTRRDNIHEDDTQEEQGTEFGANLTNIVHGIAGNDGNGETGVRSSLSCSNSGLTYYDVVVRTLLLTCPEAASHRCSRFGRTPLHTACINGAGSRLGTSHGGRLISSTLLRSFLEADPLQLFVEDDSGKTPAFFLYRTLNGVVMRGLKGRDLIPNLTQFVPASLEPATGIKAPCGDSKPAAKNSPAEAAVSHGSDALNASTGNVNSGGGDNPGETERDPLGFGYAVLEEISAVATLLLKGEVCPDNILLYDKHGNNSTWDGSGKGKAKEVGSRRGRLKCDDEEELEASYYTHSNNRFRQWNMVSAAVQSIYCPDSILALALRVCPRDTFMDPYLVHSLASYGPSGQMTLCSAKCEDSAERPQDPRVEYYRCDRCGALDDRQRNDSDPPSNIGGNDQGLGNGDNEANNGGSNGAAADNDHILMRRYGLLGVSAAVAIAADDGAVGVQVGLDGDNENNGDGADGPGGFPNEQNGNGAAEQFAGFVANGVGAPNVIIPDILPHDQHHQHFQQHVQAHLQNLQQAHHVQLQNIQQAHHHHNQQVAHAHMRQSSQHRVLCGRCFYRGGPHSVADYEFVHSDVSSSVHTSLLKELLRLVPSLAAIEDPERGNRLPLNIALEAGRTWYEGVREIFHAFPEVLSLRDEASSMYPFMLSAAMLTYKGQGDEGGSSMPEIGANPQENGGESSTGLGEGKSRRRSIKKPRLESSFDETYGVRRWRRNREQRRRDREVGRTESGNGNSTRSARLAQEASRSLTTVFTLLMLDPSLVKGGIADSSDDCKGR